MYVHVRHLIVDLERESMFALSTQADRVRRHARMCVSTKKSGLQQYCQLNSATGHRVTVDLNWGDKGDSRASRSLIQLDSAFCDIIQF